VSSVIWREGRDAVLLGSGTRTFRTHVKGGRKDAG
jgi:hypothetical protein